VPLQLSSQSESRILSFAGYLVLTILGLKGC
jgi:hypothetical protein